MLCVEHLLGTLLIRFCRQTHFWSLCILRQASSPSLSFFIKEGCLLTEDPGETYIRFSIQFQDTPTETDESADNMYGMGCGGQTDTAVRPQKGPKEFH